MKRKTVAVVTLFAFLYSSWACVISKTKVMPRAELDTKKPVINVLAVLKNDGQSIEFDKSRMGRISGGVIIGGKTPRVKLEVAKTDVLSPVGGIYPKMIQIRGRGEVPVERLVSTSQTGYVFEQITEVRIPLADVDRVFLKRTDGAASFLATISLLGLVGLGIVGIIALTKESCPFMYSYDGQGYVFDAEPYGGATCPGLQRTEWVELEHLKDVAGAYRLRLTNEVEETQYTDELKLVVVDHAPGSKIAPDEAGGIHTFVRPQRPLRATDARGRDLLPYVSETDWLAWETPEADLDPSRASTKDDLVFEFARPAGATTAKVLFNGGNTLWASQMVKRYLELHGRNIAACYAALNSKGAAYEMTKKWYSDEELYELKVRVETAGGWETRSTLIGGGPFATEDKAYVVDLSGVAGDVLRIRLTPPASFWAINSIAVDFTSDQPVFIRELDAVRAVDFAGRDVGEALRLTDQSYQIMPEVGNWADVMFTAPPARAGCARTILAKVSGYYDIHLEAKGAPRMDILGRFLTEPGFGGRFGLQEYLNWKRELAAAERKK